MNNIGLKRVKVIIFDEIKRDGYLIHLFYGEKSIQYRFCLYDFDKKIAIDIYNEKIYNVLKEDEYERIPSNMKDAIQLGKEYIVSVKVIKWKEFNFYKKTIIQLKFYKILLQYIKYIIKNNLYIRSNQKIIKLSDYKKGNEDIQKNKNFNNNKIINLLDYKERNYTKY